MDALSFIFGIAFVVVIAVAIVAVYAFVKVKQTERKLGDLERQLDYNVSNLYRNIGDSMDSVTRVMDSRFDKLENKFLGTTGSKQLLKN